MIEESFSEVYKKFKIRYYQNVFAQAPNRELSLTTIEAFCAEIIGALNNPTINEFASFINISSPNATKKEKEECEKQKEKAYQKAYQIGRAHV